MEIANTRDGADVLEDVLGELAVETDLLIATQDCVDDLYSAARVLGAESSFTRIGVCGSLVAVAIERLTALSKELDLEVLRLRGWDKTSQGKKMPAAGATAADMLRGFKSEISLPQRDLNVKEAYHENT